jgi:hypothetical protein
MTTAEMWEHFTTFKDELSKAAGGDYNYIPPSSLSTFFLAREVATLRETIQSVIVTGAREIKGVTTIPHMW